jgi:hypothetical protein
LNIPLIGDELFDREAFLFGKCNGIPEYRIVELFGEWAAVLSIKTGDRSVTLMF